MYAPTINWRISLLVKLVRLAEYQYLAATVLVFFTIFWYNTYYLTDRLIFTDILSLTRVIEIKRHRIHGENEKDFVYFGDRLLGSVERFNNFLAKFLTKVLKYLGEKFSSLFGKKNR
jgi:hypothetical protein